MAPNKRGGDDSSAVWRSLVDWIRKEGGQIHANLDMREIETQHRGVFATRAIPNGEILLRLPSSLSIDGRKFPSVYNSTTSTSSNQKKTTTRTASPWLRCLAAYYKAQRDRPAYVQSLPTTYETVSEWQSHEIDAFLAGTSTLGGSTVGWHANPRLLRERYASQIRPYLEFCELLPPLKKNSNNNSDEIVISNAELADFSTASACLSTRCFHLGQDDGESTSLLPPTTSHSQKEGDIKTGSSQAESYTGPFLLPAIDLLNHASSDEGDNAKHCTTLHRDEQGYFVMKAERAIAANDEILHSYGDHLTACQFLQTFGFVPETTMRNILLLEQQQQQQQQQQPVRGDRLTPALLSKQKVLETCWEVIESDLPARVARIMQEREMEDEIWTVSVDRQRTADFISDDLIVTYAQPLTDEIVTIGCVPFLPICAYREASQALIGKEILEDFFLGCLVCTSLLRVLQSKMECYRPVEWQGQVYQDDAMLLRELLDSSSSPSSATMTATTRLSTSAQRLAYGLTLRLEEKVCLQALRREVTDTLSGLDEDLTTELHLTKKQKL